MVIVSGMTNFSCSPWPQPRGERNAGVAAGRLKDDGILLNMPARSAASIMATPILSLTLDRLNDSTLAKTVASGLCHAV
jgi:hypothetical protein